MEPLLEPEASMSHANAALTPKTRLRLGRLVIEDGWTVSAVAVRFEVTYRTAQRWARRYAEVMVTGRRPEIGDMRDRSSRPHRQPNRTPQRLVKRIVALRWRKRLGPVEIGHRLGLAASTVHAVLVRCRLNRLSHIDRHTGEPIRRYEHPGPGSLLHVDVKKLGNIPDGGGWRYVGRAQGKRNRASSVAAGTAIRDRRHDPRTGIGFVHTVLDDYSRVVYAEIHNDERAETAAAVLRRAVAWFTARGVLVERVLSDNGSAYKSRLWHTTCSDLGITVKKTRPYRPQTNGKIERFHRTLSAWAFDRFYPTETARRNALPAWLHHYNHHRPHTAIGRQPPITRLDNLAGQHS
jgi:transposase InsO family protein